MIKIVTLLLLAFASVALCRVEKDVELSKLFSKMWDVDSNRLEPNKDFKVNLQGGLRNQRKGADQAKQRFFQSVNSRKLTGTKSFSSFIALLDNYDKNIGVNEVVTSQEQIELDTFLKTVMESKPFKMALSYLQSKRLLPSGMSAVKRRLQELWFELYGRGKNADSSGFEHVFVGEVKRREITGMHNWVQLYLEEKNGYIDYRGYYKASCYGAPRLFTIGFNWFNKNSKDFSTTLVGISPEYEFSVYTVAYLVSEKLNGRNFKWAPIGVQMGPCFVQIQCHKIRGKHIGSCYFK